MVVHTFARTLEFEANPVCIETCRPARATSRDPVSKA